MTAWTCPECAADPTTATNRSCAPRRCYCLHDSCHAAGSREARTESVADVVYLPTPKPASSWDTRKESTWIDQM